MRAFGVSVSACRPTVFMLAPDFLTGDGALSSAAQFDVETGGNDDVDAAFGTGLAGRPTSKISSLRVDETRGATVQICSQVGLTWRTGCFPGKTIKWLQLFGHYWLMARIVVHSSSSSNRGGASTTSPTSTLGRCRAQASGLTSSGGACRRPARSSTMPVSPLQAARPDWSVGAENDCVFCARRESALDMLFTSVITVFRGCQPQPFMPVGEGARIVRRS